MPQLLQNYPTQNTLKEVAVSKKRITLNLSDSEMEQLKGIVKSRTAEQRMVMRCKVILMTEEGKTLDGISKKLDISRVTANHWRHRYSQKRLDGLNDEPRSGRPWTFNGKDRLKIITHSFKNPKDITPLSSRKLVSTLEKENLKISKSTVQRILSNTGLRPYRGKKWLISEDPEFEKKITQVVGLYIDPPENALAICVDEKSGMQVQELGGKTSEKPMKPKSLKNKELKHVRYRTQSLIASLITHSGMDIKETDSENNRYKFLDFLQEISKKYPDQHLYIIMNNLKAHKSKEVTEWAEKQKGRIKFNSTPTHRLWLNQVEFWFALHAAEFQKRNVFESVDDMISRTTALLENYNKNSVSFKWIYASEPPDI